MLCMVRFGRNVVNNERAGGFGPVVFGGLSFVLVVSRPVWEFEIKTIDFVE